MAVSGLARVVTAVLAVFVASACTESFSDFDTSGQGGNGAKPDAGASGGRDGGAGASAGGDTAGDGGASGAGGGGGAPGTDAGSGGSQSTGGRSTGSGGKPTGGAAGAGGGAADGGTSSGGSAAGGGSGAGGAAGAGGGCAGTQKQCPSSCVANDSPVTGCAAASCDPCALTNVSVNACSAGACSVGVCQAPFRDCNTQALDGCEIDTSSDAANCGGCSNRCTLQGGQACKSSLCGCTADDQCKNGSSAAGLTCDTATGLCHCGAATCEHGEYCNRTGDCSCNGGRACAAGRTCCQTPAGCVDLTSTATSCGACGRSCPSGFACAASQCECKLADNCNAGSAGACTGGLCKCGNTTCAHGQRCLANGACG